MSNAHLENPASSPKTRIMLVEDEFLIRLTLAEVLSDEGYEVMEAETGDEALTMLRDGPAVQVLLTDIQLPGLLDGEALAEQVRKWMPDLPVIFMTGRPDRIADRPASPSVAYVAKPYLPSDIAKAIKAILGRPAS